VLINLLLPGETCLQPPQHLCFSSALDPTHPYTSSAMALLDRISDAVMKVVPAGHSKPRRSMSGGIGSAAAMGVMHDDVSIVVSIPPRAAPSRAQTISFRHSHPFIYSLEPSAGRSILYVISLCCSCCPSHGTGQFVPAGLSALHSCLDYGLDMGAAILPDSLSISRRLTSFLSR
jgi:hypothetical protein